MCAKLRTVTASNNRDHASQSLIIACSRHAYIFLFFAHIPFVVNHTINPTPPERLQQYLENKRNNSVANQPHLSVMLVGNFAIFPLWTQTNFFKKTLVLLLLNECRMNLCMLSEGFRPLSVNLNYAKK